MQHYIRSLLTISCLLFTLRGQAQSEKAQEAHFLLPWYTLGLVAEYKVFLKPALKAMHDTLIQNIFKETTPLTTKLQNTQATLTLNQLRLFEPVLTGNLQNDLAGSRSLAFEPIICPLATTHLVVGISVVDFLTNLILAFGYTVIPKPDPNLQTNPDWQDIAVRVWQETKQRLQTPPVDNSAMQLGFTVGALINRKDQSPSDCLNLLISGELVRQGFEVSAGVENETRKALLIQMAKNSQQARATRRMITYWQWPADQKTLPLSLKLDLALATSVLGDEIKRQLTTSWLFDLSSDQKQITFSLPKTFLDFITKEKQTLLHTDNPKVVAVDRAWVYLDKGRSWGLNIDDRLIANSTEDIRGHVIGFFGPERGLLTSNETPIHEGAIVYIRKGQKKVTEGLSFSYDLTEYPTSWPPSAKQ